MEYLREFREVAREYGALQIGEAPMTPVKTALIYLTGEERVLDMMIQFDTMTADCFMTEFIHHPFSLPKLKRAFSRWQYALEGKGWNALYLENHDHPRVISRYGSEEYWRESGTMLAAAYLFQKGTPFIYQGQELGMTNVRLGSIEEYQDVATINAYHSFRRHQPEKKRMRHVHIASRDSARTPVQWNGSANAGFSTARPWFAVNPNYREINAEKEEADEGSILNFYRRCLRLRKENDTLLWGKYREYLPLHPRIYLYERSSEAERILVVCSFSKKEQEWKLPEGYSPEGCTPLLCNYPGEPVLGRLRPYEALVLRWGPAEEKGGEA
jgi:oligo-1,6-glucosidase